VPTNTHHLSPPHSKITASSRGAIPFFYLLNHTKPPSPTHQTATADTMPPDTIIASLKQGNALELEFIKKLKEGLDVIADGMQSECYKRGDALEELRETLEGVNLDEVSFVRRWWGLVY
jgi:hypothetical protein